MPLYLLFSIFIYLLYLFTAFYKLLLNYMTTMSPRDKKQNIFLKKTGKKYTALYTPRNDFVHYTKLCVMGTIFSVNMKTSIAPYYTEGIKWYRPSSIPKFAVSQTGRIKCTAIPSSPTTTTTMFSIATKLATLDYYFILYFNMSFLHSSRWSMSSLSSSVDLPVSLRKSLS